MKPILATIAILSLLLPSVKSAADEEIEILYTASSKATPLISAVEATGQLDETPYIPAVKAQYDGFVYRSEGKATARHDEISSYVISFYVTFEDPTRIHLGHSLAR